HPIVERAVRPGLADPDEILAPAVARERIALEVEEDVSGGRLGQQPQAEVAIVDLEQFVHRPPVVALLLLDTRLFAETFTRIPRAAAWIEDQRQRLDRQPLERRQAARLELGLVEAAEARHEREVVIPTSSRVAAFPPATDLPLIARLRVLRRIAVRRQAGLDKRAIVSDELPIERCAVVHTVRLARR